MRTTDERTAAVLRRAEEIRNLQERRAVRRGRALTVAAVAACLLAVVGLGLAMPGIVSRFSDSTYVYAGPAASIFSERGTSGYVLIGILAFVLGVCVTLLCSILHRRSVRGKEDGDGRNR